MTGARVTKLELEVTLDFCEISIRSRKLPSEASEFATFPKNVLGAARWECQRLSRFYSRAQDTMASLQSDDVLISSG